MIEAIRATNREVGGRVVEMAETEFMVRGRGYLKSTADLEQIVLKADGPARRCCCATWRASSLGPDERRGVTELERRGRGGRAASPCSASARTRST